MKRILLFVATLFHIVYSADSVTIAPSQESWNPLISDRNAIIDLNNNSTRTVHVPNLVAFSTQHKRFPSSLSSYAHRASADRSATSGLRRRHHNTTPHYDLNHMSTEQLVWYFSSHGYTEDQILGKKELFASAVFVALAKQLPKYAEYVKKYYAEYRKFNWYTKFVGRIFSFYTRGFQDIFTRLYNECENERLIKEARERKAFVDKIVHESGFYSAELYHGENFVKSITFFPADWSREQVIEAIYKAYSDFIKSGMKPALELNGKYRVDAVLNKQVNIRMYITKDAVIKTAYPILK